MNETGGNWSGVGNKRVSKESGSRRSLSKFSGSFFCVRGIHSVRGVNTVLFIYQ